MTRVRLFAVPLWQGAAQPGAAAGPAALLAALGVDGRLAPAAGEPALSTPVEWVPVPSGDGRAIAADYARRHYLDVVRAVADDLATRVAAARRRGELPIALGGDHSLAIGVFAGLRRAHPRDRLGILWVDAHPDLNTPETTPSHHVHGMPLAALLGHGHPLLIDAGQPGAKLAPADVTLFGIRAIDPGEEQFLAAHPELLALRLADLRRLGFRAALDQVHVRLEPLDGVYLSFDLDAVDPNHAPGVTTPAPDGLTPAEAEELVRSIAASGKLVGADVVELLPDRDPTGATTRLAARLVRLAAERPGAMAASAPSAPRAR